MKKAFKIFVLVFLLASQVVFAQSDSEKADALYNQGTILLQKGKYKQSIELLEKSFNYEPKGDVAFNIGLSYDNIQNYNSAIKWYKKAFKLGEVDGGVNTGVLYDKNFKDYPSAIKWYKKAYLLKSSKACVNLGVLYEEQQDIHSAIEWYKKGIKLHDYDSLRGLGNLYYKQNKKIKGAAYMLGLLSIKPLKRDKLIKYLKSNWKLSNEELLKAYILQKKLIPNPYLDPEFEAKIPAPHRNRRGIGR